MNEENLNSIDCSICLESIDIAGAGSVHLPCHHRYHSGCMSQWAARDPDNPVTCPQCRAPVTQDILQELQRPLGAVDYAILPFMLLVMLFQSLFSHLARLPLLFHRFFSLLFSRALLIVDFLGRQCSALFSTIGSLLVRLARSFLSFSLRCYHSISQALTRFGSACRAQLVLIRAHLLPMLLAIQSWVLTGWTRALNIVLLGWQRIIQGIRSTLIQARILLTLLSTQIQRIFTIISSRLQPVFQLLSTQFHRFYHLLSTSIRLFCTRVSTQIQRFFHFLSTSFQRVVNLISTQIQRLFHFLSISFQRLVNAFSTQIQRLFHFLSTSFQRIFNLLSTQLHRLFHFLSTSFQLIYTTVSTRIQRFYHVISGILQQISNQIGLLLHQISTFVRRCGAFIWSQLRTSLLAVSTHLHRWLVLALARCQAIARFAALYCQRAASFILAYLRRALVFAESCAHRLFDLILRGLASFSSHCRRFGLWLWSLHLRSAHQISQFLGRVWTSISHIFSSLYIHSQRVLLNIWVQLQALLRVVSTYCQRGATLLRSGLQILSATLHRFVLHSFQGFRLVCTWIDLRLHNFFQHVRSMCSALWTYLVRAIAALYRPLDRAVRWFARGFALIFERIGGALERVFRWILDDVIPFLRFQLLSDLALLRRLFSYFVECIVLPCWRRVLHPIFTLLYQIITTLAMVVYNCLFLPRCAVCARGYAKLRSFCFTCAADLLLPRCAVCHQGYSKLGRRCFSCTFDLFLPRCNICHRGYQKLAGRCFTCLLDMLPRCVTCHRGYAKLLGRCFGCAWASLFSLCAVCHRGYSKVGSRCFNCLLDHLFPRCGVCHRGYSKIGTRCFTCFLDYYLSRCGVCRQGYRKIGSRCFTCFTDNLLPRCGVCRQGYSKIGSRCFTCYGNHLFAVCGVCRRGYRKIGARCFTCAYNYYSRRFNLNAPVLQPDHHTTLIPPSIAATSSTPHHLLPQGKNKEE